MKLLRSLAFAVPGLLGVLPPAGADAIWPSRPINLVVGQAAGGNTDSALRIVSQRLEAKFHYRLVIVNQPGASGTIAASAVLRQPADGYTFLVGGSADQVMAPALLERPGFDPDRDFVPVAFMAQDFVMLAASGKIEARNWAEVKQFIASSEKPVAVANSGNGTTGHLAAVKLGELIGVGLNHIPYRGAPAAIVDAVAGRAQLIFGSPSTLGRYFHNDQLRPIAVASEQRISAFPHIPAFKELGIPLSIDTRYFVLARTGTPPEIVQKFGDAIRAVLADQDTQSKLADLGIAGETGSPAELSAKLARDRKIWGDFIRSRNIRPN
ncbi:tripartite tricarboxylate transporter substrate binding protein [Pigmentiphaga soli]|uniref:Tripartite tricarboxylate transporter substrate binding protein n=1 Tax=Pigmentiphaga soli TaxID=1007095 RepID=A0ABP8GC35_9BURK